MAASCFNRGAPRISDSGIGLRNRGDPNLDSPNPHDYPYTDGIAHGGAYCRANYDTYRYNGLDSYYPTVSDSRSDTIAISDFHAATCSNAPGTADARAESNARSDCNLHTRPHACTNSRENSHSDTYPGSRANTYNDSHAHPRSHACSDSYHHTDGETDGRTYSGTFRPRDIGV